MRDAGTNGGLYSTQVRTKGTWQRVPPVRQSSIGHVTKSLKGRSQRPSHTDQHMPKQAHHRCSTGRGIMNDGSAPCATILPRHPESQVGPRPCTLGCVYPSALHHATAILILPSHYVAVAQRDRKLPNSKILRDRPAHTTNGRKPPEWTETTIWTRRGVN